MKYKVKGQNITITLTQAEIERLIESLELSDADSELLAAFQEFKKEEYA